MVSARQVRDGDSAYMEDSRKVQQSVLQIQQHAAAIRKEASLLSTAATYNGNKSNVQEAVRASKASAVEAKRLLEGFAVAGGGSVSEQKMRGLQQQKLTENLIGATKSLDSAWKMYEAAEIEKTRRAQDAAHSPVASANTNVVDVELHAMTVDVEVGQQQTQLQECDVIEAEVAHHVAMVDEFTSGISSLHSEMWQLQQCMVDLAEHTQAQGEQLDSIETNMTNALESTEGATAQLTTASHRQQMGNRLFYLLLGINALVAASIVFVVVVRHN